jgi:hypothetical protein
MLVWLVAIVVAVLASAGVALWRSGLVVAQLSWSNDNRSMATRPDGTIATEVWVSNTGLVDATVVGVGRDGPGLRLVGVEGDLPVTLKPNSGSVFVLVYRITDCAEVPRGSWPVTVRVDRPWGTQTVDLMVRHRQSMPWQAALVDTECAARP